MAPRKRSRRETASSPSSPSSATGIIDEAHAVLLARHLADLLKHRRFTDLKVHHRSRLPLRFRPLGFDGLRSHTPNTARQTADR